MQPANSLRPTLRLYLRLLKSRADSGSEQLWLHTYAEGVKTFRNFDRLSSSAFRSAKAGDIEVVSFPLDVPEGLHNVYTGSTAGGAEIVSLGWIYAGRVDSAEARAAMTRLRATGGIDRADALMRMATGGAAIRPPAPGVAGK